MEAQIIQLSYQEKPKFDIDQARSFFTEKIKDFAEKGYLSFDKVSDDQPYNPLWLFGETEE